MSSHRSVGRFLPAAGLALTLLVACSGPGDDRVISPEPAAEQPRQGGTIVIGAGEPACADWYAPCGAGNNGILVQHTLPAPMRFVDGQHRPTALLAGEPEVEPGPPQRVTYRINPQAVWSDGTPITAADFRYSWEQGRATDVRGMGDIAGVDDADPTRAVVTWREPSGNWRDRFQPILPRHLLEGKDRTAEMKDGYRFSGGPWMLDHWTRGQEFKIVRNPRYWGKPAHLDSVVSRVVDIPGRRQAYKTGQIDMIIDAGADPSIQEVRSMPDTAFELIPSSGSSFFVFNTQRPPFDRSPFRQALAYATDRDVIVRQLAGQIFPDARPTHALATAVIPEWYSEPFARYRRDLTKVAELMRADGWAKGPDGVWARGDVRARVELSVAAAVQFQVLLAQIVESQWKEAGFDATTRAAGPALVGDLVPKGNYQVYFTGVGYPTDPGQCVRFCSNRIPTEANGFSGGNISRIASPVLDDIWRQVDRELDREKRRNLVRRGQEALADEVPAFPLSTFRDVAVYNTTKLGGPVALTPPHAGLSDWFCKTTCG
ncbi:MAG: Oligopeptide ABC transporter, periplasmic oligopeptide-binding protein OppA [uncultured Acidimicrobiales bacterium]|uniref:Oligopeptide ABC transporter, periplasmic oligopeptide-binding protein OppA n=1 Tax=uncultured Acidimicrobiales bacterium TaxID=310071 RepID=A0A6J4H990_9ACTN|nr:MAG: Oligopeptide ABC transporter, periplasmic oligopeptide-binding protein OppA [uncultured Acidimicrobiales bacterium]